MHHHLRTSLSAAALLFATHHLAAQTIPSFGTAASPSVYQLSQKLLNSESTLKAAIDKSADPEASLAQAYGDLQELCKVQFDTLENDYERYKSAEARTNFLGNVLALLGSVATYAPGKTVLMGLGISSGSSGTVSSSVTQFFSTKSAADQTTLAILRNQLSLALDRYEAIEPANDKKGTRRKTVLGRAKGICLGLTPLAASTPPDTVKTPATEAPAPAPAPATSASGASAPG